MNRLMAASFFVAGLSLMPAAEPDHPAAQRVPVLLELFTSEGCSSCPPADRLLETLDQKQPVSGANLIVLSEHVDYWNSLGWKDPFSSPLFSARQQQYADRFRLNGVYTPELVVDGETELVGGNRTKALAAIEKAAAGNKIDLTLTPPVIDGKTLRFHVTSADLPQASGDAELYIALAQSRTQSQVAHGENAGSLLTHVGVTRVLTSAGKVKAGTSVSKDLSLSIPADVAPNGLRLVAFVQSSRSHRILGAAQSILPLP